MDLVGLAINILWLLIGVIIILAVVWLAFYVIKLFCPVPDIVEKAVWAVVLILILIAVLTLLAGRGGNIRPFWRSGLLEPAIHHCTVEAVTCDG